MVRTSVRNPIPYNPSALMLVVTQAVNEAMQGASPETQNALQRLNMQVSMADQQQQQAATRGRAQTNANTMRIMGDGGASHSPYMKYAEIGLAGIAGFFLGKKLK